MSVNDDEKNQLWQQISKETNAAGKPHYDMEQVESTQIQIKVDNKVAPAMFIPDKLNPQIYWANAVTISAMKKDIFVTDLNLQDYSQLIECQSCGQSIDQQFWHFCPHCEAQY